MKQKQIISFLLLFFLGINTYGQNPKIDSLLNSCRNAKHDTTRIKIDLQIGQEYLNLNLDSAFLYFSRAFKLTEVAEQLNRKNSQIVKTITKQKINSLILLGKTAIYLGKYDNANDFALKGLKLAEEQDNKTGIFSSLNVAGIVHFQQGHYDTALVYYQKSLSIAESLGNKSGLSMCYMNIGNIHREKGSYEKAIECYHKSLKFAETLGLKFNIFAGYVNIGIVQSLNGNYETALEYDIKALKLAEELGNKSGISQCYTNIGNVYSSQGQLSLDTKVKSEKYNLALENHLNALKYSEECNDIGGMSRSYSNIGIVYRVISGLSANIQTQKDDYQKAIEYHHKALKIDSEIGDQSGMVNNCTNISSIHLALAGLLPKNSSEWANNISKAMEYGQKSFQLARELKVLPSVSYSARNLMDAYKNQENYKKALGYAEIFIDTRDSIFNQEKTKALTEMEAKYQNEKKQKEIEILEKDKTIIQEKTQKQKIIIISISAGLGLLVFMVTFILRRLRITRRQKKIIEEKNVEITAQNTLINQQKNDIVSSITYASRIQNALIPPVSEVSDILPEYFILFKPRDIVSGDFFWVKKIDNLVYIVAADCTGHGVPGAFMSMLGISLLNEILSGSKVIPPHEVLNELRIRVKKSLHQKGDRNEAKDGMDIALCLYDYDSRVLHFAGAHNPLYIVRNHELIEYKADRMPIGVHHNDNVDFTTTSVELKANDLFYIFSDGYASQFGGIKGETFKSKRLQELLLSVSEKSMVDQKEILNQTIEDWRGDLKQIDDICVIGVKVV